MNDDEKSIEIPVGSRPNVQKSMNSPNKVGSRWRCYFPPFFSYITLNIILILFFLASVITSVVLTDQNYNTAGFDEWMLVGRLSDTSASFRVRRAENPVGDEVFVVSTSSDLLDESSEISTVTLPSTTTQLVDTVDVQGLTAGTRYYYGIVVDDAEARKGSFRTAPVSGQRSNFKFATAGCAYTGTKHQVFDKIRAEDPLFFLHLGDFHYEDISENDVEKRIAAVDKVLGSPSQREMFQSTSFSYMWDDHDWLGNNSGGQGEGRESALESYRVAFPHFDLPSMTASYQAYTIGTVRFIVSDLRAESTEQGIYSQEQKEWLFSELAQTANYDFVVWVTTKPWIGEVEVGEDSWFGQPSDRQELSEYISQTFAETQNLIAISADAHMVAFDSGVNTYYGTQDGPILSFPILQSGPMDRPGSVKGGPFSDGCTTFSFERNHQYSTVEFNSDGEEPCLLIKSYRIDARTGKTEQVLDKTMCGRIFAESDPGFGSCKGGVWSGPVLVVSSIALGLLGLSMAICCFLGKGVVMNILFLLTVMIWFVVTIIVGLGIPYSKGVEQHEQFEIAIIGLSMMAVTSLYLSMWCCCRHYDRLDEDDHIKPRAKEEEPAAREEEGESKSAEIQPITEYG